MKPQFRVDYRIICENNWISEPCFCLVDASSAIEAEYMAAARIREHFTGGSPIRTIDFLGKAFQVEDYSLIPCAEAPPPEQPTESEPPAERNPKTWCWQCKKRVVPYMRSRNGWPVRLVCPEHHDTGLQREPLTIDELIVLLEETREKAGWLAHVSIDGCDCSELAADVKIEPGNLVTITRVDQ